jgi:IclR family mhp operon transcriptional activator
MAQHPQSPENATVRSLARGLAILRHINQMGEARPGEIAKALDLPRPTVYRLLETLEQQGYVAFSATANHVRITRLAASLGDGYALSSQIAQAAGPIFADFATKLVWPLDLTVYKNAAMVIQETTHARSPLSIDRGMTGYRLPVLRTAPGRAYLAFCPDEERQLIVDHIRQLDLPEDRPFLQDAWLAHQIAQTRARGVGLRDSGEFREHTASIAAPILAGRQVLGCVSVIYIRSAMSTRKALDDLTAPLQQAAARIAACITDAPRD